jgi:hypothetical protein
MSTPGKKCHPIFDGAGKNPQRKVALCCVADFQSAAHKRARALGTFQAFA